MKCRRYPHKATYATRGHAERVAGRRERAERGSRLPAEEPERPLRIYACAGHYHLTSTDPR